VFVSLKSQKIVFIIFTYFKKVKKLNNSRNGIDLSSNIGYAKKSMTKVMNNHIEKFSSLLNGNVTQFKVTNRNEISIKCENAINAANVDDDSCSST
jgi:hypothetical protein